MTHAIRRGKPDVVRFNGGEGSKRRRGSLLHRKLIAGALAGVLSLALFADDMPFWGITDDGKQCDATMMVRTPDCQKSKTFDVFNSWDWSLSSALFPFFNSWKSGLIIVVQ